jgi:GNAT superfamily N-acetyltransferase
MKINRQFVHLLSHDELSDLQKSISKQLPESGTFLNVLKLKIGGWLSKATQTEFYLYEENGNRERALQDPFVVCIQQITIHSLYAQSIWAPKDPTPDMLETFEAFIRWDKSHIFSFLPQTFVTNHFLRIASKHGAIEESHPKGHECEFYALDEDSALDCPNYSNPKENMEVRELSVNDSEEMTRNYYWAQPHTQAQFEEAIRNIASCGVYVNSNLACSCVLSPSGLMNALYTDTNYRRKGYGVMVLKTLGKRIAEMGLIPTAECETWNEGSRGLIKKSGFKYVGLSNWIVFKPFTQ